MANEWDDVAGSWDADPTVQKYADKVRSQCHPIVSPEGG